MEPLVSIIMPAYNIEQYIHDAISSVLAQTYTHWELLVVNDGSTDGTEAVVRAFTDPRIKLFSKLNGGIGSARNHALPHVRGRFICGLDADDLLPPNSVKARMDIFIKYPDTDMVDGKVIFMDANLEKTIRIHTPKFMGDPFPEIVGISGRCFMGFSWLIRWQPGMTVRFNEQVSHGEDMIFYMEYSPGRLYRCTEEPVLIYRRTGRSSMSDLAGLERSYKYMENWLKQKGVASREQIHFFRRKRQRIMAASYWKKGKKLSAFLAYFT